MSRLFGENVYHIAFVAPDLDREVDRWLEGGIGPFYFARDIEVDARYRGARHDLVLSAAFACRGALMVEILTQHNDAPSSFLEYLQKHPDGGLHHIAYLVDDIGQALAEAAARGQHLVAVQEFLGTDGMPFEIYLEAHDARDPILTQIVLPSRWSEGFRKLRDIAATWDGSEPRRKMDDLFQSVA